MNVPEMQRLIDHLKALPPIPEECFKELDCSLMGDWEHHLSCGTVGCIEGEFWSHRSSTGLVGSLLSVMKITPDEYNSIVYANYWKNGFSERHDVARANPNAERALMVEYLEWIVADPARFSKAVAEVQGVTA